MVFFSVFKVCCLTTNPNFQKATSQRGPSPTLTGNVHVCLLMIFTIISISHQQETLRLKLAIIPTPTSAVYCTDTWPAGPLTRWNPSIKLDWSGVRSACLLATQRWRTMCVTEKSPLTQNTDKKRKPEESLQQLNKSGWALLCRECSCKWTDFCHAALGKGLKALSICIYSTFCLWNCVTLLMNHAQAHPEPSILSLLVFEKPLKWTL